MSIKVGTKVRVDREASFLIRRAAKAGKKTFLIGRTLTSEDPCCGCYIVEFTKNIGTDSTYGTSGKMGFCSEVDPEHMRVVGEPKVSVKASKKGIKVGDYVRWNSDSYGPAKKGAIGIVRTVDSEREVGVEFIKDYNLHKGHELDGSVKNEAGWYVNPRSLTIIEPQEVFSVGDKVEIIERHDAANKGMKGTIRVIDEGKASHPFGVQFPGWEGGHSLDSLLGKTGKERFEGQWVPASSMKFLGVEAKAKAPKAPLAPKAVLRSKPYAKDETKMEGGYRVRLLKAMKTSTGGNALENGSTWSADKVIGYYGETYFLIPFGGRQTILAHESDIEVL